MSIQVRPSSLSWTREHEVHCWEALQNWRALSERTSGAQAALAWCGADALGKGGAMTAALLAAAPAELSRSGCEQIAAGVGCDLLQYRALLDSTEVRRRAMEPMIRAQLPIRSRNCIINRLFASHFVRWAQQHFSAVGESSDTHKDDRRQYVLCYLTARMVDNNGKNLLRFACLPRAQPLLACHESDDDEAEGATDASDPVREYAARAMLQTSSDPDNPRGLDVEDTTHTPIRAHLFELKRYAVIDYLRGRRNYLFHGTRPPPTLMRIGVRADAAELDLVASDDAPDPRTAMEDVEDRPAREEQMRRNPGASQDGAGRDHPGAAPAQARAIALEALAEAWPGPRRRVYDLWTQGQTPKAIAAVLHVSKREVNKHLDTIRHAIAGLDNRLNAEGAE